MNFLVQRAKVRGQMIAVPEGLPELLSDITREVLRCQPTTECLCQFIIDYLVSVLQTREKARVAKNAIDQALRIVDEIIADMCICDIGKTKSEHMAAAMEECFKRFLERQRCEKDKEKEIIRFGEQDILDELIARCKFTEQDLKISRPIIEDAYNRFVDAYMKAAEESEDIDALYLYFKERERLRMEEEKKNFAAIRIQAFYRGYAVRRSMFLEQKDGELSDEGEDASPEMEDAAAKIQKFYRAHLDKKKEDDPCMDEVDQRPDEQTSEKADDKSEAESPGRSDSPTVDSPTAQQTSPRSDTDADFVDTTQPTDFVDTDAQQTSARDVEPTTEPAPTDATSEPPASPSPPPDAGEENAASPAEEESPE